MAAFGAAADANDLLLLASGIQTFSETVDSARQLAMQKDLSEAETVVSLGFSYQQQNLDVLALPTNSAVQRMYGTAYGISGVDVELITKELRRMIRATPNPLELANLTCRDLFGNYGRSMTR
jgi:hypothetical protein